MRRAIGLQVAMFTEEDRRYRLEAIKSNHLRKKSEVMERHMDDRKPSEQPQIDVSLFLGPRRKPLKIENPLIKMISHKYLN